MVRILILERRISDGHIMAIWPTSLNQDYTVEQYVPFQQFGESITDNLGGQYSHILPHDLI